MSTSAKTLKTCSRGHKFYKTSSCPTCPVCEKENKPPTGFLSIIAAPARRALESEGIVTPQQLAERTEKQILQLHGMGPGSIPKLRSALEAVGLGFKK
jgi:NADH:ubiquinone oxidoreductase subunit F (NADH-binding)